MVQFNQFFHKRKTNARAFLPAGVLQTQAGVLKGKFGYMSPEQVRGLDIDHRSDVFAVGILMYEIFTGTRLFLGESDFSTLEKVRQRSGDPL